MNQATALRIAKARLELIAEQLRSPSSSSNLTRALELVRAAARRLELEADNVPVPFRLPEAQVQARRAVVSRDESYVEYDDGTRVPR